MFKISQLAIVLSAAALMAGCSALPGYGANSASDTPVMTGGWGPAKGADVDAAAAFALGQLNRGNATITTISDAKQQVVAGMNYSMKLSLSDGSQWQVVVYKRFDGMMELTSANALAN